MSKKEKVWSKPIFHEGKLQCMVTITEQSPHNPPVRTLRLLSFDPVCSSGTDRRFADC